MPKGLQINAVWQNPTTKLSVCSSVHNADSNQSFRNAAKSHALPQNKALLPGAAAAQANTANRRRRQTLRHRAALNRTAARDKGFVWDSPWDLGRHCRGNTCVQDGPRQTVQVKGSFPTTLNRLGLWRENKGLEAAWMGSNQFISPELIMNLVTPLRKQELWHYLTSNVQGLSNNETR